MSDPLITRKEDVINKEEVEKAIKDCFEHVFVFKSKVYPTMVYHVSGKKILDLYERLGIK